MLVASSLASEPFDLSFSKFFASVQKMAELIRDTAFGHLIRFVFRKRFLKFAEEEDPSIWTRYIDEKKSGYLAYHGSSVPPEDGFDMQGIEGVRTRENQYSFRPPPHVFRTVSRRWSHRSEEQDGAMNLASGVQVDPEKGKDVHVVSWYSDDDPEMVCTYR